MSGFSGSTICPNCGASCDEYTDWKPFNYTSIKCLECGFMVNPVIEYMSLEELNIERENYDDLKPLKKLPKQEFNW